MIPVTKLIARVAEIDSVGPGGHGDGGTVAATDGVDIADVVVVAVEDDVDVVVVVVVADAGGALEIDGDVLEPEVPWFVPEATPEPDGAEPLGPEPDGEIPLLAPDVPEPGEPEDAASVPEPARDPEPDDGTPLLTPEVPEAEELEDAVLVPEREPEPDAVPLFAPESPLPEAEDAVAPLEPLAPEPSLPGPLTT